MSADFDLVAAGLRADAGDLATMSEVLATTLENAVPSVTTVERRRTGRFSGPRVVSSLQCTMGDEQFRLRVESAGPVAERVKVVRGIAIKTDQLPLREWLSELIAALQEHAAEQSDARAALAGLLG